MSVWTPPGSQVGENYLLLADISGYTAFLAGVEQGHGVDFSAGIPAGYGVLAALLDSVVEGVQPDFRVEALEGDAVFAAAHAGSLDGQGDAVLGHLRNVHRAFRTRRADAVRNARDHICVACPVAGNLDLKMVLHRGQTVRQVVGTRSELIGPAVNVAHRLLKNGIASRIGYRPYLFLTDVATVSLGLPEIGMEHREEYADVGPVEGRIVKLDDS